MGWFRRQLRRSAKADPLHRRGLVLTALGSLALLGTLGAKVLPSLFTPTTPNPIAVSLRTLGHFELDRISGTTEDIPAPIRALDGKVVSLDGEIFMPDAEGDRIRDFVLVYDLQQRRLGPPVVQDRVFVAVPGGNGVRWYPASTFHRVTGTLHVNVLKQGGEIVSVFTLDVESIASPVFGTELPDDLPSAKWLGAGWVVGTSLLTFGLIFLAVHHADVRRRRQLGCCPACRYDLRGNVSGVSPECESLTREGVL